MISGISAIRPLRGASCTFLYYTTLVNFRKRWQKMASPGREIWGYMEGGAFDLSVFFCWCATWVAPTHCRYWILFSVSRTLAFCNTIFHDKQYFFLWEAYLSKIPCGFSPGGQLLALDLFGFLWKQPPRPAWDALAITVWHLGGEGGASKHVTLAVR